MLAGEYVDWKRAEVCEEERGERGGEKGETGEKIRGAERERKGKTEED